MSKQEEKPIDLNDYIKRLRTNVVLIQENNKEQMLKIIDELSGHLFKVFGELEVTKAKLQKEESVMALKKPKRDEIKVTKKKKQ